MSVADQLVALAGAPEAKLLPDVYGRGGAHEVIEETMQELLGKPAAVFLPKGVIAQLAALRTWADRSGRDAVALHPQSHIEADEDGAYAALHRLRGVRVGRRDHPFSLSDFDGVGEALAAVVVELPVRRAAFSLPTWEELGAICGKARDLGAARHMDGARLWECIAWFDRSYAEICGLFDSVYVSFYKGLGGLGGAALAGERDFIDEVARLAAQARRPSLHRLSLRPGGARGLEAASAPHARIPRPRGGVGPGPVEGRFSGHLAPDQCLPARAAGFARRRGGRERAHRRDVRRLAAGPDLPAPAAGAAIVEIQIGDCAEYIGVAEAVSFFDQLVERARSA